MNNSRTALCVQLCHLTTVITCLLCIILPFTAAYPLSQSEVPTFDDLNKRDIGLEQCKVHPRNCPGGYVLTRRGLSQRTPASYFDTDAGEYRAQGIRRAGEDLRRSLRTLRDGLRYKLLDMKRSGAVYNSDDSSQEW